MGKALSNREIMIVVNRYIGVEGGYLGDFTYRTHTEFYPLYCDLDIDPNEIEGTTRERFIHILSSQLPRDQAKIIRGVLERFPLDAENIPKTRNKKLFDDLLQMAIRLETEEGVSSPTPDASYEIVTQALQDAEALLNTPGATSGVDRLFTALHGYMEAICSDANIAFSEDQSIVKMFKIIKEHHPAFQTSGPRGQDIVKVLRSLSAIVDALQPVRNKATLVHPNEQLLELPEAMLVINSIRTLMHYLDNKILAWENDSKI